jgi:hypothetical protein
LKNQTCEEEACRIIPFEESLGYKEIIFNGRKTVWKNSFREFTCKWHASDQVEDEGKLTSGS